jgi:hypothetical protein
LLLSVWVQGSGYWFTFIVILDGNDNVLARTSKGEWKRAPALTPENVLQDLKRWAPKR